MDSVIDGPLRRLAKAEFQPQRMFRETVSFPPPPHNPDRYTTSFMRTFQPPGPQPRPKPSEGESSRRTLAAPLCSIR